MINANELRIGNWVKREVSPFAGEKGKGEYFQWSAETFYWIVECVDDYENFEPIPFSAAMLDETGTLNAVVNWLYDIDNCELDENGLFFKFYGKELKIEYVHQLQNLYFTLTGQELEINLAVPASH